MENWVLLTVCFKFDSSRRLGAQIADAVVERSGNLAQRRHGSAFVQSQLNRYRERYVQTAIVVGMLIAVTLIDLACLTSPR